MSLHIDSLATADLTDAEAISTSVGWNQTYTDWKRVHDLFSETCFAGYLNRDLVATSTLVTYGDRLGWIGMVLVDPDYRKQGYGSAIFEHAVAAGRDANLDVVGLDATNAGRRIYDKYGFERTEGINRWRGALGSATVATEMTIDTISDIDSIVGFDARHATVDRSRLIAHLLDSAEVTGYRVSVDGELRGFAIVRPGRICPQIGPIIATDSDALESLLTKIGEHVDGEVIIDGLDRDQWNGSLERAGLAISRSLHRMTYEGALPALDGAGVVAATGFEWG